MCHLQWQPPQWNRNAHQKHRKANVTMWNRSVTTAMTGEPEEPSQFNPYLSDPEIEKLEVACVTGGGVAIKDRCHKRTYWMKTGQEIGACTGQKTRYIFVEYLNSGTLHGWPVSWEILRKKGVKGNEPD